MLEEDLAGANTKIIAKSIDIDVALTQMGYQIHAIFIHTGNQKANDYVLRPITQLMGKTIDDISTILLELKIKILRRLILNKIGCGQS